MAKLRCNRLSGFPRCLWFSNQHNSFGGKGRQVLCPASDLQAMGMSLVHKTKFHTTAASADRDQSISTHHLCWRRSRGSSGSTMIGPYLPHCPFSPSLPFTCFRAAKFRALSHLCWKAVSFSGSNGLCSPLSTLAPPARNKWPSFTNLWLLVLVCLACTWEGQSLPWRVYHQNSKELGWKTTSALHLIPGDGSMQRSNLSMETMAGPLGPDMHLPLSKKKGDLPLSSKSNPS